MHHQTSLNEASGVQSGKQTIDQQVKLIDSESENNCYLRFDDNETLWSIAKQYKNVWRTSIYSALLAIYKTNLTQFKNQNINRLVHGKKLTCPSERLIRGIDATGQAREQFITIMDVK